MFKGKLRRRDAIRPFGATLIGSSGIETSDSSLYAELYAGARLLHNESIVASVGVYRGNDEHPGPCLYFWSANQEVIFSLKLPLTRESVMEAFARMVEQSLQEPQG